MSTFTLSKSFRFESAHRLAKGYQGKCANVHGHSWNGELIVQCTGVDQHGMALDYAELKEVTRAWEDTLDHKLWLYGDDPLAHALREEPEWKSVVLFEDNPTSENLAKRLAGDAHHRLRDKFGLSIIEVSVVVRETCTTSCTYTYHP